MSKPLPNPLAKSTSIFVSPHLDDAALSCGGTIAKLVAAGEIPVIATAFSEDGGPAREKSAAARAFENSQWHGADSWATRRQEDQAAMIRLGAVPIWLGFIDALYRGYRPRRGELFGAPRRSDEPLSRDLAKTLVNLWRQSPSARVYLPLGIGGHVDHRLVRDCHHDLSSAGAEIWFYEDFPYVLEPGRVAEATQCLGAEIIAIEPIDDHIDSRIHAIEAYGSQLAMLFGPKGWFPSTVTDAVRSRAAAVAQHGGYAEAYWRINPNVGAETTSSV